MYQSVIETSRLELHHIPVQGLVDLYESKSDTNAIAGRDIKNLLRVLLDNPGPLAWRVPQVKQDPSTNKWFVRFIVESNSKEIVGSTSFHGVPDSEGMIEIGLGIEPPHQGKGYAKEALLGMWRWAGTFPEVKTLRYTVSPENLPSIAVINYFGFPYVGQQMDEIDGPENIYEISKSEFLEKWGSQP